MSDRQLSSAPRCPHSCPALVSGHLLRTADWDTQMNRLSVSRPSHLNAITWGQIFSLLSFPLPPSSPAAVTVGTCFLLLHRVAELPHIGPQDQSPRADRVEMQLHINCP